MRKLMLVTVIAVVSATAIAGGAEGIWRTEANDDGGYIEITVGPCAADASKTCGTISKAMTNEGENPQYQHLGELMVKDMSTKDGVKYSGGTIWDPQDNKTYKAKMHLDGDELDVKGCVSVFCSGQNWARVK